MHLKFFGFLVLAAATALAVGCSKISDKSIKVVTYQEAVDLLEDSPSEAVLLDVRPAKYHEAAHIPGSVNIPLPELVSGDARLAEMKYILVYASDWTDPLAPAGVKRLLALDYEGVFEFRGGVSLWQSEGRALEGTDLPVRDPGSAPLDRAGEDG